MATTKIYKLTKERYNELEEELHYAKTVREGEVAEQIKEARSFGDLSENSEYDEAKNEQGKLYSRIAEIEDILAHAVIIEDGAGTDNVDSGCKVKIADAKSGKEFEYQIVGSQEANPKLGRISDESPLGKALIGAKVGDTVQYDAPMGTMYFEVKAISR